jgi:hypothetical protein
MPGPARSEVFQISSQRSALQGPATSSTTASKKGLASESSARRRTNREAPSGATPTRPGEVGVGRRSLTARCYQRR